MKGLLLLFILSLSVSGLLFSCKKHRAKKIAGDYDCTVKYHSWNMSTGEYDSTYTKVISVIRQGESLEILDRYIHVDYLCKGDVYSEGSGQNTFSVRIEGGELHATESYGGLGGGSTTTYIGDKL